METEVELKFQVPQEVWKDVAAHVAEKAHEGVVLKAHYYDTAEGLLARAGASLRLRQEDGRWVQTLKARARLGAIERFEHNVAIDQRGEGPPTPDLSRHQEHKGAQDLLRRLQRGDEPGQLQEVYATSIVRRAFVLETSVGAVELALDEGEVIAGDARRPVRELEMELKAGSPAALFPLALEWVDRHGLWLDVVSKGRRGALLAQGRAHEAPLKARAPRLEPGHERRGPGRRGGRGLSGADPAQRERGGRWQRRAGPRAPIAGGPAAPAHRLA